MPPWESGTYTVCVPWGPSGGPEAIQTPIKNQVNGDVSFRQAKFDWNCPIW